MELNKQTGKRSEFCQRLKLWQKGEDEALCYLNCLLLTGVSKSKITALMSCNGKLCSRVGC